jgi:hypothetical protein
MALLTVACVAALYLDKPLLMPAAFVAWMIFIFSFAYISSVAGSVFQCALYLFSAQGTIPPGFTTAMMESAFRRKK